MRIENHKENLLYGAIGFRSCVAELGLTPGVYQCKIKVKSGALALKHYSYDLQVGSWCNPPEEGEKEIRVQEGEDRIITLHCCIHDGQADEVCISNESWTKKVIFHIDIFTVEKEKKILQENAIRLVS